jgi:hypothetical protein
LNDLDGIALTGYEPGPRDRRQERDRPQDRVVLNDRVVERYSLRVQNEDGLAVDGAGVEEAIELQNDGVSGLDRALDEGRRNRDDGPIVGADRRLVVLMPQVTPDAAET